MKKSIVFIALTLVFLIGLSSCVKKKEDSDFEGQQTFVTVKVKVNGRANLSPSRNSINPNVSTLPTDSPTVLMVAVSADIPFSNDYNSITNFFDRNLLNLDDSTITLQLPLNTSIKLFEYTFNQDFSLTELEISRLVVASSEIDEFTITDEMTELDVKSTLEIATEPTSITVSPVVFALKPGESHQFTATAAYSEGNPQDVTTLVEWSSPDTGIVGVTNDENSKGMATGAGSGSIAIVAAFGDVKGVAVLLAGMMPTASDKTVNTNEDTDRIFSVDDFNFSDTDSGDSLNLVKITVLENNGELYLDSDIDGTVDPGEEIVIDGEISSEDIPNLRFKPAANANGNNYATFSFQVSDGVFYSADAYAMTINVAAVNDAPFAMANTVGINEDTDGVFSLDDFKFSDFDTGDSLDQVQITVLESAGDLYLDNNLNGRIDTGEEILINQEVASSAVSNLKFKPAANANGADYSTFSFKVSDGKLFSSSSYHMTIDVASIEDAPMASPNMVSTDEDTDKSFASSDFNFSDPDGDGFNKLRITVLESVGELYLDTNNNYFSEEGEEIAVDQEIPLTDIPKLKFKPLPNENGVGYSTFNYKVNDGKAYSASEYLMTIDVNPVNDPPVSLANTIDTNEDTDRAFDSEDFRFEDPEGTRLNKIRITILESAGDLYLDRNLDGVIDSGEGISVNQEIAVAEISKLKFKPILNAFGVGYAIFDFKVSDGVLYSTNNYRMTIDVKPVDDRPTASPSTVNSDEDTDRNFATGDFNFSDPDGDSLNKIRITVLESVGELYLDTNLNGIIESGEAIAINQEIPFADISKLKLKPVPDANGFAYSTFRFKVHDGISYSASDYSMTVDVDPVNDAPMSAHRTVNTNEDTDRVFGGGDFDFTDTEGASLFKIQITILASAGDLYLDVNLNDVIDGGEEIAVDQEILAADLAKLKFKPVADANGTGYATFNFKVNDGTDYSTGDYVMTVDVDPANDAPTSVDHTVDTNEDTDRVFGGGDFGFSDPDGDTLTKIQITVLESAGALYLDANSNGTVDGGEDIVVDQEILLADLAKLKFKPVGDANGVGYATFSFKVSDGTSYSADEYAMTIDVDPQNDPPTATANTVNTSEDTDKVFGSGDFGFSDPDGDTLTRIQITVLESAGALYFDADSNNSVDSGEDIVVDQEILSADLAKLKFKPAADANGAGYATFGFKVNDGTSYSAVDYAMTINVDPMNDPPVASANTV
ncbi:MAG: hypothetical protein GY866_40245, partial [Proteobacteria bacterium]|nr:hypothetical protein [Pseudomonadota bacterium]